VQARAEVAAEGVARREEGRAHGQDGEAGDDRQPETGPTITCEACPNEWRRHGWLDYVTRDFTLRASGHAT
jgi:hypothetical protein